MSSAEELNAVEEFNAKWKANYKTEGFGFGNVYTNFPCPFCAEPGFARYELLEMVEVMSQEHVCAHCKRGQKVIFTEDGMETHIECVQTQGPDVPDWYPLKMRRVENGSQKG